MKLISLNVSHLFGLKHNVKFDFTENNRICIIGENGSGKSSVMDSIRLALFGEASQSRAVNIKDYIRRGASEGAVFLEFEDNTGRRHRVSRKFKKNSKDAVSSSVRLESWDGQAWEDRASSISAVNFAVASILLYGRIRDDVKDGDTIKQAKSSVDISAFISQGNISKILSVTPHERTALVSSALNIQDGDFLREQVKELKKIADGERSSLKTKAETIESSLRALPEITELRKMKKKTESDIEIYSASHAILSEGARILDKISDTASKITSYRDSKRKQEELISSMRNRYAYGEFVRARADLVLKAASYRRMAAPCFVNAPLLEKGRAALKALLKEKESITAAKAALYEKYSSLSAKSEFSSILTEVTLAEKRAVSALGSVKEKEAKVKEIDKELSALKKELEKTSARLEGLLAAEASAKLTETEAEITRLSGTLLSHLVELLRALGAGDIIDLNKLSLSGAETFVERMKDSGFQAILYEIKNRQAEAKSCKETADSYKATGGKQPKDYTPEAKKDAELTKADLESKLSEMETALKTASDELSFASRQSASFASMAQEGAARLESMIREKGLEKAPSPEEAESASKSAAEVRNEIRAADSELNRTEAEYTRTFASVSKWESELELFEKNSPELISAILAAAQKTGDSLISCMAATGAGTLREACLRAVSIDPAMLPREEEMRAADTRYSTLLELLSKASQEEASLREAYEKVWKKDDVLMPSLRLDVDTAKLAALVSREKDEKASQIAERTRESGRIGQQIRQHETFSAQLANAREEIDRTASLYTSVKQLSALADANFGRYICDKTMEILFEGVNRHLDELGIKWTLGSDNGQLMVSDTDGEIRPVSGMSGGEATLISILLLKQISNFNCLWLDESLTMLDENKLSEVTDILTGGDPNAQVIVISHDKDLARTFDTVWKMDSGQKIEEEAKPRKKNMVITADELREGDFELI